MSDADKTEILTFPFSFYNGTINIKGKKSMDQNKEKTSIKYEGKIDLFKAAGPDEVHVTAFQEPAEAISNISKDKSVSEK